MIGNLMLGAYGRSYGYFFKNTQCITNNIYQNDPQFMFYPTV